MDVYADEQKYLVDQYRNYSFERIKDIERSLQEIAFQFPLKTLNKSDFRS